MDLSRDAATGGWLAGHQHPPQARAAAVHHRLGTSRSARLPAATRRQGPSLS